jgi:LssY C-terminus
LEGRPPDMVFQKSLGTFAERHHLRVWKLETNYNGQGVWIGAATHDIATTNPRAGTKWAHRIDLHVDRERDWVKTDLLFAGTGKGYADIARPAAPRKLSNATGDEIVTDGKISVVQLANTKGAVDDKSPPTLSHGPSMKFGVARAERFAAATITANRDTPKSEALVDSGELVP